MIIINLLYLYHKNCIAVFEAIHDGYDFAPKIAEKTGLGAGTVSQILNELIMQKLITYESISSIRNAQLKYSVNKDLYILYIEKKDRYFHFLSISPYGKVLESFDFPTEFECLNPTYSLKYIISLLKGDESFEGCKGIYISDINLDGMQVLDPDVKIINSLEMIIDQYANDSEINLIEYMDKKALIIYSHIHYTDSEYDDIVKVLRLDNHIVFDEDRKNEYILNSLGNVSLKSVKNHIYTIAQKAKNKKK